MLNTATASVYIGRAFWCINNQEIKFQMYVYRKLNENHNNINITTQKEIHG